MANFTADIDNQRLAALQYQREMEHKFQNMVKREEEYRNHTNQVWQGRMDTLIEQYQSLANATGSFEKLRAEVRQEMKEERSAYLKAQRRSEDYFVMQLTNMQSLLNTHMKSTSATIASLTQSISDIRARLRSMGDQISSYLVTQAQFVK